MAPNPAPREAQPPQPTQPPQPPQGKERIMAEPIPIDVHLYLVGMHYPASKEDLVETARGGGADDDVLNALESLPDREYDSPDDVSSAVSGRL
jgi:hypothetical protein